MRGSTDPRVRRHRDGSGAANRALVITLALALGVIVAMVWLVGGPISREVQAMPSDSALGEPEQLDGGIIRVATTGEDTPGCGTVNTPCRTVQYAVDQAQAGDEIRVASGVYTDMHEQDGLFQMVYLDKSVTIRGGYTTANWTTSNPDANPTTLDAEGQGRVMVITPTHGILLEGLRFEDGNATGLGGGPDNRDAGGGLYILTATVTISGSVIFSSTASITGTVPGSEPPLGGGFGGGLYARGGFLELMNSEIVSNTAGVNFPSYGGGLYLDHGDAILSLNKVMSNTACYWEDGYGGGLYLDGSEVPEPSSAPADLNSLDAPGLFSASLLGNTIQGNEGSPIADGWGGGMFANHYQVELLDNLIQYNIGGRTGGDSRGGGVYIFLSDAWLERNRVLYNIASGGDEGISGGVHFCTSGPVTLRNNTILGNIANTVGNGYGGGVSFCKTTATLDSNAIISNTATLSTTAGVNGWGGGVWTGDNAAVSFNNDLIAGNHARTQGSGLWFGVENSPYNSQGERLTHVTIADNIGGLGHGIYVTNAVAFLTNTIISGHEIGVLEASGGAVTLEATLWYGNATLDTVGTVEIGSLNFYGNPAFVDPVTWDYHIGEGSAALDQGVVTGVHTDMDGQPRPWGLPDLGADEVWPPTAIVRAYLPLILRE